MEPITQPEINLFGDQLPSMDEIQSLSEFVHASEGNLLNFSQQVEANMGKSAAGGSSAKGGLAGGIGLYILGRFAEAAQMLQKTSDCKEKYIYLAFALRRIGKFEQAIENLQKSLACGADTLGITLQIAATYRDAGNFDAAAKEIKSCANFQNISAEYHYQFARLQEALGLYDEAVDNYKIALELSPNHKRALFHLAYRCNLSGDEEAAIDYYKQITSPSGGGPVYVSALLNLAVLYEDKGEFDKASQCVDMVLDVHPNHQRAILFKKISKAQKRCSMMRIRRRKNPVKTRFSRCPSLILSYQFAAETV